MSFHTLGRLVVVVGVIMALVWVILVLRFFSPEEFGRLKDIVSIIQSGVTVVAIVAGGIIAAAKLELFRDFEPHLTVSHTINYRPIGDSYVHIDVTATLHNSSRVKVELREGIFRLQEIVPVLDDQELEERLAAREVISNDPSFVQWPAIGEFSCNWGNYNLVVEPGQVVRETVEFIISKEIKTVVVRSIFHNLTPSAGSPQGWRTTTVYDMMDEPAN